MKNLYLIQPNFKQPYFSDAHDKSVEGCFFLPYSVASLWAYAKQFEDISNNYDMKSIIFRREPFSKILDSLEAPNIAGFSNYSWCWEFNVELARQIKEQFHSTLIVFGGPMIPDDTTDFFCPLPVHRHRSPQRGGIYLSGHSERAPKRIGGFHQRGRN